MRTAMMAGRIGSAELTDLVARGATLDSSFPLSSLPRLASLGPGSGGATETARQPESLSAHFTFQPGAEGFPRLHLVVDGVVPLVCQRCLELLELPVSVDVLLTMVSTDEQAQALTEPFDTVLLADGELVPGQVVEDEVLAALPLAPKHADRGQCGLENGPDDKLISGEMHRPMAGLADLLGRVDRQDDK
jgi:uncharacterized protein